MVAAAAPEREEAGFVVPRYDLGEVEVARMTRDYLSATPHDNSWFLCVEIEASDPMSNAARYVEETVFNQSFSNSAEEMEFEYGPYEDASSWVLVLDLHMKRPMAVIRMIHNSPARLKSLNDVHARFGVTEHDVDIVGNISGQDDWLDIGTLGVLPAYRGQRSGYEAAVLLYRATFDIAVRDGISKMVAVIDAGARKNIDRLGIPFRRMEGTPEFDYLGSPRSLAMYGKVEEFEPAVMAKAQQLSREYGLNWPPEDLAARHNLAAQVLSGAMARARANRSQRDTPVPTDGSVPSLGRYVAKQQFALAAARLATGVGLDEHIRLR